MRHFNILGSLIFLAIGYMVLIKWYSFPFATIEEYYAYSAFLSIGYFATQGIGVVFRRPGKQFGFHIDLFLSILPLFIAFYSFINPVSTQEFYSFFRLFYLLVTLTDLIIFVPIDHRFAIMTTKHIIHD